jgi:hypothetical protein
MGANTKPFPSDGASWRMPEQIPPDALQLRMLAKFVGCVRDADGKPQYEWTRAIYLGLSNSRVVALERRGWIERRQTDSHATEWRLTAAGALVYRENHANA